MKVKIRASLEVIFPEVCRVVEQHLKEEFPHLRYSYFVNTLKCEVLAMTYTLIELEVIDFREEWKRYNGHTIQCFIQNFAAYNCAMNGYTPAREITPHIILNISAQPA